ncbi:erythromycin esterase family protein [Mycobacterium sp.]|uniref:erythromycin esterase family protein n=1 Tax=Mycobacterium sp. TaxID=1785 RepID=UPI002DAE98FD|nr:erythromycin esterase family protein [Mycobacterium sp.]
MNPSDSTTQLERVGWPFGDAEGPGNAVTSFLNSLTARPQVFGLGEPTHGLDELPRLRNRIIEHLVEHEGYRSVALESDCLAGLIVDDFISGATDSLDGTMRAGFSHGFGESAANRELVAWMAEQNRSRDPGDRLRFYGFDAPTEMMYASSPRAALIALHDYLATHLDAVTHGRDTIAALVGDDDRWTNPAAAMDPTQSVGASDEVIRLRVIADDLGAQLLSETPRLVTATSQDDWWRATLWARAASGLLRYHAGMADTAPNRVGRLMALRDAMMAENLLDIAARERQRGPVLVFAHNGHLQKNPGRWLLADMQLTWWTAGAIAAAAHLGDEYATLAIAFGAAPERGLDAPSPETVEGTLAALPATGYVFTAAALANAVGDAPPRTDQTPRQGYFPVEALHLDGVDGVLFIREV